MNKEVIKKMLLLAMFSFLAMTGCSGFTEDWVATGNPDPQEVLHTPFADACALQGGQMLIDEDNDSLVFMFRDIQECAQDESTGKWDDNFRFADTVRVAYSLSEDTLMLSFDGGAEKGDITILLVAESKLNGCLFINAEHGCDSMQTGAGRLDGEWKFLPCAYIGGELNCDSDGRERFIGFDVEPWLEDKNVEYRVGQKKEP